MAQTATISQLMQQARRQLEASSDTPSLDSQLLMMRTIGRPRGWLLAHPEHPVTPDQQQEFEEYVRRCVGGEALPYVLGWWEFYGRQFHLSPAVLIPRPETEHLVETALSSLAGRDQAMTVVDVGTGSGCIVVTLALEMPAHQYLAIDISQPALAMAKQNLIEYRLERDISLIQADLLQPLQGPVDMIVANLPYIRDDRLADLKVAEREPELALAGGEGGLELVQRLADSIPRLLAPGGEVILELDPEQMEPAREILRAKRSWASMSTIADLAGHDRIMHAVGAD